MSLNPTVNGTPAYKLDITWQLGGVEDISYTVMTEDTAAMQAGSLPTKSGRLPVSFGAGVDAVMLSTGAQLVWDQPGYVTESGKSVGLLLEQSAVIGRLTAQQITVQDAFNGSANSIAIQGGNPHVISGIIPDQAGIASTPMGLSDQDAAQAFSYILDSAVANLVLDVDINEDNALHAIELICEGMGTFTDPQQTQFYIDSGTNGPDGARSVVIGRKGGSAIAFGVDNDDAPILRMSTAQAQTTDMCASCTFTGGDTHHGLPSTGKITDMRSLYGGQAVVGVYSQIDQGGVYFWRGDGAFYPMSQAMGVNAIWYDRSVTNRVYAATDAGIYAKTADVFSTDPFTRLGTMSLKCLRVQQDGGTIYALVEFAGSGARHVLAYEDGRNDHVGYQDWKDIYSFAGLADFAVIGDTCYAYSANSPQTLQVRHIGTSTVIAVPIPSGASILGLDPISADGDATSCIMVRTDQGSADLYFALGGTVHRANTDASMHDNLEAPVMVNSVRAMSVDSGGALSCSSGRRGCAVLASTTLGVFGCGDPHGASGWFRTDGQSSIGDFTATFAAAGISYPYDGREIMQVYAASDTSFYVSQNGSMNWIDALSEPLGAGPYFYDRFWQNGAPPPPGQTSVQVSYGGKKFLLLRQLNGINQWRYALVNPDSPVTQHRVYEFPEISAPGLVSEIKASSLLVEKMARYLALTAEPQGIVEILSVTQDAGSALARLRPCMAASVSGEPIEYIVRPNGQVFSIGTFAGSYFVLSHTVSYDQGTDRNSLVTRTKLGRLLLHPGSGADPGKLIRDIGYQTSRQALYKAKSRR